MKYLNKLMVIIISILFLCSCSNVNESSTFNKDDEIKESADSDLNNSKIQEKGSPHDNDENNNQLKDTPISNNNETVHNVTTVNAAEFIYDYERIYSFREMDETEIDYFELASFLQPKELDLYSSEYNEETHILRISYDLNLTEKGQIYNFDFQKEVQDSMVLFAILDDIEGIEFEYIQIEQSYSAGGIPYSRSDIKKISGIDVSEYGKTKDTFTQELAVAINKLDYKPDLMEYIDYEHIMGFDTIPDAE